MHLPLIICDEGCFFAQRLCLLLDSSTHKPVRVSSHYYMGGFAVWVYNIKGGAAQLLGARLLNKSQNRQSSISKTFNAPESH